MKGERFVVGIQSVVMRGVSSTSMYTATKAVNRNGVGITYRYLLQLLL